MKPLPTSLCSSIITDKLWFTENILCLLSNAVKYSGGDTVTVYVSHILNSEIEGSSRSSTDNSSSNSSEKSKNIVIDSYERRILPYGEQLTSGNLACPGNNSAIIVRIEDAGVGISEEAKKKLFHPFKQVQRLAGGTGKLSDMCYRTILMLRTTPLLFFRLTYCP